MYINPFVAGVLATLFLESIVFVAIAIIGYTRHRK